MSQTFSTELVPVSDRIDAWPWNARQFCGDCRFQFPNRRRFHGSIASKRVGNLDLSLFSSSSLSFQKFPTEIAHPEHRFCTVITQLEGARQYSQNGIVVLLKPGDSTLIDSAAAWSSDCLGDCVRLYLRAPRWLMEDRLRTSTIPIAHRIPGTTTLGAALFHLANSLYREADHLSQEEGAAMVEAYFDLLSGCVGHPTTDTEVASNSSQLLSRFETFIEGHLAEPTLGPAEVAAAAGISVRHAHRLFSRKGCTIADWIWRRRLEQCRRDLADPRLRERTITDIAFYWGFSESAHFSRSFKQRFGVCPRTFRSRVWTELWNEEESGRRAQSFLGAAGSRHSQPN
jgi:AraC family transcriptional regulator, positive regulator of tynA and feaB